MKLRILHSCFAVITLSLPTISQAQTFPADTSGTILTIWADPSDIVIKLSNNGPCGNNMFNIKRGTVNFSEFVSLMYTAAMGGKLVDIYVSGCDTDGRNLADHAAMIIS